MTAGCKYTGGINVWAALASAALHTLLLGAFATVRPSAGQSKQIHAGASVAIRLEIPGQPEPIITPVPKVRTEQEKKIVVQKPVETPEPVIAEPVKQPDIQFEKPAEPAAAVLPKTEVAASTAGVSLFGGRTVCQKVCYVVDCSGSMYGCFRQLAKELSKSVAGLNQNQSFYVIFFRDGGEIVESGTGKFEKATMKAKSKTMALINSIRPEGQTMAKTALRRAMQIKDEKGGGPEVIYFLTDGFDLQADSDGTFVEDVMAMAKELAPQATICTAGLWSRQQDKISLRQLAEATGGMFVDIQTADD